MRREPERLDHASNDVDVIVESAVIEPGGLVSGKADEEGPANLGDVVAAGRSVVAGMAHGAVGIFTLNLDLRWVPRACAGRPLVLCLAFLLAIEYGVRGLLQGALFLTVVGVVIVICGWAHATFVEKSSLSAHSQRLLLFLGRGMLATLYIEFLIKLVEEVITRLAVQIAPQVEHTLRGLFMPWTLLVMLVVVPKVARHLKAAAKIGAPFR